MLNRKKYVQYLVESLIIDLNDKKRRLELLALDSK